jgi:hypothetical protein
VAHELPPRVWIHRRAGRATRAMPQSDAMARVTASFLAMLLVRTDRLPAEGRRVGTTRSSSMAIARFAFKSGRVVSL